MAAAPRVAPPLRLVPQAHISTKLLEELGLLAASNATGEFVVVDERHEIRIYLERGQLAWASTASSKHAFTGYLEAHCGVDKEVVAEAVRECRKAQRPIGELLVEWNVVDESQVRAALQAQILGALEDLRHIGDKHRTLYIPRRHDGKSFQKYTFDVGSLLTVDRVQPLPELPAVNVRERMMAKIDLAPLSSIDGYVASAIVDSDSGMSMGEHGHAPFSLEVAAAGNTEVVRAKRKTMQALGLAEKIEDILISLGGQYHVIRPVETNDSVFIYVVLDRSKTNLAMARHVIRDFEKKTTV